MKRFGSLSLWLAGAVAISAAAQAADFDGLGDLSGGSTFSQAVDVSDDGLVVVGRSNSSNGMEAFRWVNGTMTPLGFLSGGTASEALGVSGDGSVVVGRSDSTNGARAFRWTNSQMTDLGCLSGGSWSRAFGVSSDGLVVVGESDSTSGKQAFRWVTSTMSGLGDLSGGNFHSFATDASGDGSVVAGVGLSNKGYEAFVWEDSTMTGLDDLPGKPFLSHGNAISLDGEYVVGCGATPHGVEAVRWTGTSEKTTLGDLPGGSVYSVAKGVSRDGNVVVGYGTTANGREAFIWDPIRRMRSLKDVLIDDYGLSTELSGWTLTEATAVSPDGHVIVGFGEHSGNTEGWIAVLDRGDITPGTHDWDDWDATMSFVVLDSDTNGKVEIEVIKYVWVASNFNTSHCQTDSGICLEHLHFQRDVTEAKANYFWDWYYNSGTSGYPQLKSGTNATNDQESIADGMDGFSGEAEYNYWLVHGDGANQSDKAFSEDCNKVTYPTASYAGDRLAYDEGGGFYDDEVYDHVTKVTGTWYRSVGCGGSYYPDDLEWKCGYSGVYEWKNKRFTTRKPNTPGRSDTEYTRGESPTGTYGANFWNGADLWRAN